MNEKQHNAHSLSRQLEGKLACRVNQKKKRIDTKNYPCVPNARTLAIVQEASNPWLFIFIQI